MITTLKEGKSNQEAILKQFAQTVDAIRDQMQFSSDYQSQLAQGVGEIHNDTHTEMVTINANIGKIEGSQKQLTDSLQILTHQIDEQRQQAIRAHSQAEADEWSKLQDDAIEPTTPTSNMISNMQDKTLQGLNSTAQTLKGVTALSGNQHLGHASNKVSGLSNTFDGIGKIISLILSMGSPNSDTCPSKKAPEPRRNDRYGKADKVRPRILAPPPFRRIPPSSHDILGAAVTDFFIKPSVTDLPNGKPPLFPRSISEPTNMTSEVSCIHKPTINRPPLPPRPSESTVAWLKAPPIKDTIPNPGRPKPLPKPIILHSNSQSIDCTTQTSNIGLLEQYKGDGTLPNVNFGCRERLLPMGPTSRNQTQIKGAG